MKVIQAKSAGFCYGVQRAVELAEQTARERGGCVMLGSIIHNAHVVQHLEQLGAHQVAGPEEIRPGDTVLIRAHGEKKQVIGHLKDIGAECVDATCPNVLRVQQIVAQADAEGRVPIIIGDPNHPEVMGVASWSARSVVFEGAETLQRWLDEDPARRELPLTAVAQTTCIRIIWDGAAEILKKQCTNAKIFDTICNATHKRQSEAAELASQVDVMVVVGDRKSANTKHLTEICSRQCPAVYQIERAEELKRDFLTGCSVAGLTAGASTPAGIIKEVYTTMSEEIKTMEPTEESFEEMLEKSFKTLNTGEKVTGIVTAVGPTEVQVDLGCKHAGYIPVDELTADPSVKPEDVVKVGDEIETYVIRVNDVEGYAMLSKKRLDAVKGWEEIEAARENKTALEGKVTEDNKGGVVVNVKGVRVFVPASQTGQPRGADSMSELIESDRLPAHHRGQPCPPPRRRFHPPPCSMRPRQAAQAARSGPSIEDGKHYTGTVKSMTSYGAVRGHRRRGRHGPHLRAVLDPHQAPRRGRLRGRHAGCLCHLLRPREAQDLPRREGPQPGIPGTEFMQTYQVGDVANVRIVKLMTFGAFAEVVPGVDGLIHISQIADRRIDKPGDVLAEGQKVDVKITDDRRWRSRRSPCPSALC